MLALWTKALAFFTDEDRGASMVEYALLVVLIAIIAIVAIRLAGNQVASTFDTIASSLGAGELITTPDGSGWTTPRPPGTPNRPLVSDQRTDVQAAPPPSFRKPPRSHGSRPAGRLDGRVRAAGCFDRPNRLRCRAAGRRYPVGYIQYDRQQSGEGERSLTPAVFRFFLVWSARRLLSVLAARISHVGALKITKYSSS